MVDAYPTFDRFYIETRIFSTMQRCYHDSVFVAIEDAQDETLIPTGVGERVETLENHVLEMGDEIAFDLLHFGLAGKEGFLVIGERALQPLENSGQRLFVGAFDQIVIVAREADEPDKFDHGEDYRNERYGEGNHGLKDNFHEDMIADQVE